MLVRTLSAVSIAALLASPALAQSTSTPSTTPAKPPMAQPATPPAATPSTTSASGPQFISQHTNEWRGSVLMGEDVVGSDNKSIGEINDVLIDNSGMIKGVVIGVGGFLGIGEKNVAVPFNALTITRQKNDPDDIEKITVTYTKQQLEQAPAFKFAGDTKSSGSNTGSGSSTAPAPKR